MLELFTPYLFQDSYRRRTDQEHPSAKERSSMLKTFKTAGYNVNAKKRLKHFSQN
jgi:hypothetical protein